MKNRYSQVAVSTGVALLFFLLSVNASSQRPEPLFDEDFSKPIDGSPNPVWSWNIQDSSRDGMMLGEDDIYEVVSGEQFLSHRQSLRLNFSGRNGFCNTCGGEYLEVASVTGNEACISGHFEGHDDYVYNLSNKFSTWNITRSSGNQLCFTTDSPKQSAMGDDRPSVQVGDSIFLPNICGETGTVGRNINRRSDCDKAINQLSEVSSHHLAYGESISRRFYLYIPESSTLPDVTFKLGYSTWQRPGERFRYSTLKISVQRGLTLELHTPDGNTYVRGASSPDAYKVPLNEWVYFEEVFTRESSPEATDASYTLYVGSVKDRNLEPITEVKDFVLGELRGMSIGGNWQHMEDVDGYVYFDNILISKGKSGQVNRPLLYDN